MRRGLAPSREQARGAIGSGQVLVGGSLATKPARLVGPDEPIRLVGPRPRYVGRGGLKLEAALERFPVDVTAKRALDAGSSTGGFTDCLLQHGASAVVAVDVGRNQLHERLRADPHVDVREQTNVRDLTAEAIGGPVPVIVADLSFISLRTVADALLRVAASGADLVLLVKPQFEAGRVEVSKGRGVIGDPDVWSRVVAEVASALAGRGAAIMGAMASPLRGADGNAEFLLHARAPGSAITAPALEPLVMAAVAEARDRPAPGVEDA